MKKYLIKKSSVDFLNDDGSVLFTTVNNSDSEEYFKEAQMIKVFCDECKSELSPLEIEFSNEMIGTKVLCSKHASEHITNKNNVAYARLQKLEKEWIELHDK
jgi:hypothetical protein